jgi:hypothetical protein
MSGSPFLTITNDQVFIQTEDNVLLRVLKNTVESASSKDGKWEYYELDGKIGIYSVEKDLTWEFDANEKSGVHKLEPKVEEKKNEVSVYTLKDIVFFTFWGLVFGGIFMILFLGFNGYLNTRKDSTVGDKSFSGIPWEYLYGFQGPPGVCLEAPKEKQKLPTIPAYAKIFPTSSIKFASNTWLDKKEDETLMVVSRDCEIAIVRDFRLDHKVFNNTYGYEQDCYLKFQPDGNLVLYHDKKPLWSSGTQNQGYESMYYDVENKSFKFF